MILCFTHAQSTEPHQPGGLETFLSVGVLLFNFVRQDPSRCLTWRCTRNSLLWLAGGGTIPSPGGALGIVPPSSFGLFFPLHRIVLSHAGTDLAQLKTKGPLCKPLELSLGSSSSSLLCPSDSGHIGVPPPGSISLTQEVIPPCARTHLICSPSLRDDCPS